MLSVSAFVNCDGKSNLTIFPTSLIKKLLFRGITCNFLITVLITIVSLSLKSDSHVSENFCQIKKLSPALFEKIPSFVCLVFKFEIKWILKLQILFSWKTCWFKNKLYQAVTFHVNDYLRYVNSKILFLLMI